MDGLWLFSTPLWLNRPFVVLQLGLQVEKEEETSSSKKWAAHDERTVLHSIAVS